MNSQTNVILEHSANYAQSRYLYKNKIQQLAYVSLNFMACPCEVVEGRQTI